MGHEVCTGFHTHASSHAGLTPPSPFGSAKASPYNVALCTLRRAQTQSVIPVHCAMALPENHSEAQRARNLWQCQGTAEVAHPPRRESPEGQKLLYAATTPAQRLNVEGAD